MKKKSEFLQGFVGNAKKTYGRSFRQLKKSTLFRMLLFYCSFMFIIIYFITTIQMHYSHEALQAKVYDSHISGLRTMQVYSDAIISQKVNEILLSMQVDDGEHSNIYHFVNEKSEMDEERVNNTYVELSRVAPDDSIVYSIELYNKYSNVSISSYSGSTFYNEAAKRNECFFDERGPMWVEVDNNFISIINTFPLYVSPDKKVSSSVIKLDKWRIQDLLKQQQGSNDKINFFICDNDFCVLAGTSMDSSLDFSEQILRRKQSVDVSLNGETCKTFYVDSEFGNWKYVYTISNKLYKKEIDELNRISFLNALAMIFFSFCGLIIISMWVYRPIREMLNVLKSHFEVEPQNSDVGFISERVNHLIKQVDDVNAIVKQNEPLLVGHLIMENVYGVVETAEWKNRLIAINENFEKGDITPITVNLKDKILQQLDAKQQSYLLIQVSEIITNSISEKCPCIATKISHNTVMAFVLCDPGIIFSVIEKGRDALYEFGLTDINIIIGEPDSNAELLGHQCREMLKMEKYSFLYGYKNILYGKALIEREQNEGKPISELIALLENLLINDDVSGADKLLKSVYDECMLKDYSCDYIKKCFLEMLCTISLFCKKYGVELETEDKDLEDLHNIYLHAHKWLENIPRNQRKVSKEKFLVQQAKEYIERNAAGDIAQSNVAKELGISPEHLSRTFKKITGVKFSDYVTEVKVSAVAQMLLEHPEMKISKVVEHFGYYNMNYFNTIFKKRFFMTPSQYRKQGK